MMVVDFCGSGRNVISVRFDPNDKIHRHRLLSCGQVGRRYSRAGEVQIEHARRRADQPGEGAQEELPHGPQGHGGQAQD